MTLSDLTSKKPEELNVMCAELCGWKLSERKTFQGNPIYERDGVFAARVCAPRDDVRWLPNYTGSWDAIMPEVRKLEDDDVCDFDTYIWQIINPTSHFKGSKGFKHVSFKVHSASPLHLTIALILTLTSQH